MLSIGKLGRGQERYYLDKVAEGAEDYYAGEGEARRGMARRRRRATSASKARSAPSSSTAMLTGKNPVDGEPLLSMRGVRGDGPVPGFDLTFSAPKSVSLLWGLGGPVAAREVQAAHREAIGAALSYMQREACWTRRGAGGREFVKGKGYLAAAYRHRSSRNGDPQLHTHVLIANATQGPDGRWTRLYHPAIYDHATTACYIYEAHLRHELTQRLGVRVAAGPQGHRRDRGLRRRAPARVLHPPRGNPRGRAGRTPRRARCRSPPSPPASRRRPTLGRGELLERWRSRAQEIGLDREAIERTFDAEAR